jgi:hypothetical protein
VLGLIWQLIKMYLFKQISISAVPGLINLLMGGEDIADLMKLSPEQLLVRWVNHQLQKVRLHYLHLFIIFTILLSYSYYQLAEAILHLVSINYLLANFPTQLCSGS